ncbi:MAG: hypothetical protein IJ220_03740 [Clostridia bacterium]|nr:hypothetical protein [Clostridia bacterium]
MNKRIGRIMKSFLLVTLACGILIFSVVSLNSRHIEVCDNNHCSLCSAINFSQEVVMIIMAIIVTLSTIIFLISFYLAELWQKLHHNVTILNTLVYRNIQLNE